MEALEAGLMGFNMHFQQITEILYTIAYLLRIWLYLAAMCAGYIYIRGFL